MKGIEGRIPIWTPDERDPYRLDPEEIEGEGGVELEAQRAAEFKASLLRFREATDRRQGVARFGADLGKSLIKYCAIKKANGTVMQQEGEYKINGVVNGIDQNIRRMFPAIEAEAILSGFHSEFGAAQILSDYNNIPLYFPSDDRANYEEGMGIDWWADMSEKKGYPFDSVPIQVKSVPFRSGSPNQILYFVNSEPELRDVVTRMVVPQNLDADVRAHRIQGLQEKIYDSGLKLIQKTQARYGDSVAPALMLMPGRASTSFEEYRENIEDEPVNLNVEGMKPLAKTVQSVFLETAKNREHTQPFTERTLHELI